MAKRQLAERTNTEVAMPVGETSAAALIPAAQQVGANLFHLAQARDQMNMNNMLSDANTEMAQVTAKWQLENASNPFDPEAAEKLKMSYGEIFNKYGEKVSVTSRGDWTEAQGKLTGQYVQSNLRWGVGQAVKNAESSVNMSFEKGNQFAYQSGVAGTDVGLVNGNYATRAEMIKKSLTTIGKSEQQIEEILANHKSDYTKNYVTGAIFRNPDGGAELLKDKKVIEDIGSPEAINSLRDYAKKRKAQINEEHSWIIDDTTSQAVKTYVLDPNVSFAQGMAYIEDQYLSGNLGKDEGMKKALERNLKSAKAVEATTHEKTMTDLLLQISDAQAPMVHKPGKKISVETATDFLNKIGQIRAKTVDYNSDGVLYKGDVDKIEKELTATTAAKKKMSDATQAISKEGGWFNTFTYKDAYEGKEYFGGLPLSERDGALRDFFYAIQEKESSGSKMSNEDRKKLASEIRQTKSSDFLSKTNENLKSENKKNEKAKITPQVFSDFKEAKKANLKKGTRILVDGVEYEAP